MKHQTLKYKDPFYWSTFSSVPVLIKEDVALTQLQKC